MESHEIKQKMQSLSGKGRFTQSRKHTKQLGFARDAQGNLHFAWKENALNCTILSLTLVSNAERGMLNLVHKLLVCLEEIFIDIRH